MRILNSCEVLHDSIMQTGVCASRSSHTLFMLECSYSTRPAQPHFAAVNCSDAVMSVFYSLLNCCVVALILFSSDILAGSA